MQDLQLLLGRALNLEQPDLTLEPNLQSRDSGEVHVSPQSGTSGTAPFRVCQLVILLAAEFWPVSSFHAGNVTFNLFSNNGLMILLMKLSERSESERYLCLSGFVWGGLTEVDQLLTGNLEFISSICGTSCGYSQLCLQSWMTNQQCFWRSRQWKDSPRTASGMEKHSSPNHWSW